MKLLVSALEPSSNLHLKEVLKYTESLELLGIFDKNISKDTPLYDISQTAIMGVVDAIKKIRWFYKVADEMVTLAKEADKVLLMDSSGFNLPLAKKLKSSYPDKEILYYILPQVWASRPKRVVKLEKYCDKLLGILPFEVDYYPTHKATYVGHPLLDELHHTHQKQKGTIAFMPGSRKSEITRLLPIFKALRRTLPEKEALLIVPPTFSQEKIAALYGDIEDFSISRDTHEALAQSEFAFICSGTATLEAALIGTPFTLAFIAKKVDFFIGTKLLGIKQIGLANILLQHHNQTNLHKELLQEKVTVKNLLQEYHTFNHTHFSQKADELRTYLHHGSSQNVAHAIME
jgi:lipid-A-disaccharide synthase